MTMPQDIFLWEIKKLTHDIRDYRARERTSLTPKGVVEFDGKIRRLSEVLYNLCDCNTLCNEIKRGELTYEQSREECEYLKHEIRTHFRVLNKISTHDFRGLIARGWALYELYVVDNKTLLAA